MKPEPSDTDAVLEETLDALEMPPAGIVRWLEHDRAFCEAHGGRRVYGGLLSLLDACEAALRRPKGLSGPFGPGCRSREAV